MKSVGGGFGAMLATVAMFAGLPGCVSNPAAPADARAADIRPDLKVDPVEIAAHQEVLQSNGLYGSIQLRDGSRYEVLRFGTPTHVDDPCSGHSERLRQIRSVRVLPGGDGDPKTSRLEVTFADGRVDVRPSDGLSYGLPTGRLVLEAGGRRLVSTDYRTPDYNVPLVVREGAGQEPRYMRVRADQIQALRVEGLRPGPFAPIKVRESDPALKEALVTRWIREALALPAGRFPLIYPSEASLNLGRLETLCRSDGDRTISDRVFCEALASEKSQVAKLHAVTPLLTPVIASHLDRIWTFDPISR